MKSIKLDFEKVSKKYGNLSSFVCFGITIKGKGYSSSVIRKNFNKLVDPEDYDKSNKKEYYQHFNYLSNLLVEARKGTQKPQGCRQIIKAIKVSKGHNHYDSNQEIKNKVEADLEQKQVVINESNQF